ncbi:MAG: hypothetical protein QME48_08740 [bacterium]|uniref:Uncharacterized protein n=2 Tax=Bacteria candidate phyla TaxID=1783234 RepID=A0A117M6F6_UNCT6|nr:MAG: hypothetical protein XD76_1266 [candidate division TA06 bacterium 32_111]KUK86981.1 MAG: hypothetical protein XE03_1070 [candidate division TA06 bacterium 34_109]MDI6701293.1 hypothetical protein [bacterium]HAF07271.1 hypothetical protein [candidate division WOR-3 bacterium]HCP16120.1 hypothetical protein [candidate division WOR-3 bacterium]
MNINNKIIIILFALILFVGCAKESIPTKIIILKNSIIALDSNNRTLWKMTEGDSAIESFAKSFKVLDSLSFKEVIVVPHYTNTVSPHAPNAAGNFLDFLYCLDIKKGKVKWKCNLEGLHTIIGSFKVIPEDIIEIIPEKDNFLIFTTMRVLEISKNGKLIFWNNYSEGKKDIEGLVAAIMREVKRLDENKFLLLGTDCFGIYNKDNRKIELYREENSHNLPPVYANGKIYWLRETVNKTLTSYFSLCQYSTEGKLVKTLRNNFLENIYEQNFLVKKDTLYLLLNSNKLLIVDLNTNSLINILTSSSLLDTLFCFGDKIYFGKFRDGKFFLLQNGSIEKWCEYESYESLVDRINGAIHIVNPRIGLYINREKNLVLGLDEYLNVIMEKQGKFLGIDRDYWAIQGENGIIIYRGLKKWLNI